MEQVTSRDGTTIAFDRIGQGPPVILVTGSLSDREDKTPLAEILASDLTVLNYDRWSPRTVAATMDRATPVIRRSSRPS